MKPDTPLHRRDWEPSGTPRARLVVVHGFGEHAGMDAYAWFARRLVSAGYAVHAFDQRGHGRSPGRRGYVASWDDYRADIDDAACRARARGDARIVLIGVSLGGLGILEYLVMRPDAPVVGAAVIGGVIGRVGASPVQLALGRIASRVWPTMPVDPKLDLTNLSRDQAAAAAFAGDPLFHQQATARGAAEFLRAGDRVRARLDTIRVPVLVLHGADDRIAIFDRALVARLGTPAAVHVYPGARHQLLIETNRDEIVADLLAWLNALTAVGDATP